MSNIPELMKMAALSVASAISVATILGVILKQVIRHSRHTSSGEIAVKALGTEEGNRAR